MQMKFQVGALLLLAWVASAQSVSPMGGGGGSSSPCTATTSGLVPTPPNDVTKFLDGTCSFSTPAGGGNVVNTGTPLIHQIAVWTNSTTIKGIAVGTTDKPLVGVTGADPAYSKLTLTNPATAATLTVADGKTATISNTLTLTATDGSTLAIGTGGTLGSNAYTSTAYAPLASPTFTGTVTIPTPFTIGAVSMTATGTQLNYLNAATGTTGTASTNVVFSASPTFTGVPLAPTAAAGTSSTQLATTAFVAASFFPTPANMSSVTGNGTVTMHLATSSGWTVTANGTIVIAFDGTPQQNILYTFIFCNDGTARSWTLPGSFLKMGTPVPASVCITNFAVYDGTNFQGLGSSETPSVLRGVERSAPATSGTSAVVCWWDSTGHNMQCNENAAGSNTGTGYSLANASNKWLNSFDATTGLFTQTQPAFSNLSGSITLSQTPLTTRGDILVVNSTPALARLAKGTQYQTLQGGASDTLFDAVHLDQSTAVTGNLLVANGGTGLSSGTSGGVLAYTASGVLASSGALTANLPVIGGGAGAAPTVGTRTGNTTQFASWTGATTAARCVDTDASGNLQITGSDCGSGGGSGGGTSGWSGLPLTFATTTTQYAPYAGGGLPSATETAVSTKASGAATISKLHVTLDAQLGASATLAVTLEDGTGNASALTCTTASGGTSCDDATHSVNVADLDLLSWKLASSGTVTAGLPQIKISYAVGTSNVGITSIGTTSPITGGTITTTGTIACATCVVASSPGAGLAHFAGSTQTVTSSAVVGADMTNNTVTSTQLAVVNARQRCIIYNDSQTTSPLVAAQFSGHCVIPAASTIVEVDVAGGTQVVSGSAAAPTYTGTGSIQIGKHGVTNNTALLSGALATASGVACALTGTSGTCIFDNGLTSSGSITISTTGLSAGDELYVSAATADAAQTWYLVNVIYTIN